MESEIEAYGTSVHSSLVGRLCETPVRNWEVPSKEVFDFGDILREAPRTFVNMNVPGAFSKIAKESDLPNVQCAVHIQTHFDCSSVQVLTHFVFGL